MCMLEEISLVVLGLLRTPIDLSFALSLDCVNKVLDKYIDSCMCLAKSFIFPILCLLLRECTCTKSVSVSYIMHRTPKS